jgi:hypothetical protein
VGGDWYDVFALPDGRLGVVVGDVAGSGLEAGVIMGRMRSALRACVLEAPDPGAALRMLDRKVQYFEPDAMATVLYGLYTPRTGEFSISLAGHLPPVLAAPGRRAALLAVQPDPPIGAADDPPRRTTVFIPPGALFCCYTDGLVERRDASIDHGIGKLAAILAKQISDDSDPDGTIDSQADDACAAVMHALTGNAAASDDIAVLMLRRRPSGKEEDRRIGIREVRWKKVRTEAFGKLTCERNAQRLRDELARRDAATAYPADAVRSAVLKVTAPAALRACPAYRPLALAGAEQAGGDPGLRLPPMSGRHGAPVTLLAERPSRGVSRAQARTTSS